jgi:hypothetical protein
MMALDITAKASLLSILPLLAVTVINPVAALAGTVTNSRVDVPEVIGAFTPFI